MRIYLLFLLCNATIFVSCTEHSRGDSLFKEQSSILGDTVSRLDNNIMVIHQDKNDNYWFGSWKSGVYKYDGEHIIHYNTKHGLSAERIDEIKEDSIGNIYFTSCHPMSSISKFDGKSFTTLSPVRSNEWKLQSSDMWFKHAYQNEKVYRYDGEVLHELRLPKPPYLPNQFEIYSIYKDSKDNIWFGTNPVGVCRYDGKVFDWITEEDVTEFRNEGANGVRSIAEDKNGDFWFNTEYRYTVYDTTNSSENQFYTRHESIGGLDGEEDSDLDEYLSIVRDEKNHLWFVTYMDGVWKYDGDNITHHSILEDGEQIPLFSIYTDKENTLWLGTHEHGVYKFNGETFEQFSL